MHDGWQTAIQYAEWRHTVFGGESTGNSYGVKAPVSVNALSLNSVFIGAEQGTGAAVFIKSGAQITVSGCDIEGYSDYGIYISSGATAQCRGVSITGNYFELQKLANIRISGHNTSDLNRGISITGNFMENNGQGGRNILCEYTDGTSILGNECHGALTDAVLMNIYNTNAIVYSNAYDVGTSFVFNGVLIGGEPTFQTSGTYTPVFTTAGGGEACTYTGVVYGKYTRIGKQVQFSAVLQTSAFVGGSGAIRLSLPFTASGAGQQALSCGETSGWVTNAPEAAYISANSPFAVLMYRGTVSTPELTVANITSGASGNFINISGTYFMQ